MKRTWIAALVLAASLAGIGFVGIAPAMADTWPSRPVKVIVPYSGGGAPDLITRAYSEVVAKHLGQPFVIENRTGASGAIGTEAASRAAPDGYTLLATPTGPLVLLPNLRKLPYAVSDFEPVASFAEAAYAWGVRPELGVKTLAELIAMAKAKPGQLTFSSGGVGTATHLRGEALNILAGVNIQHIPYRTGAEAIPDLLSGTLSIMLDNIMFPQVRTGKVVLLAMTTDRRLPDFPDVPTIQEAGYDIQLKAWYGYFAPKGTPAEIQDKLAAAVAKAHEDKDLAARALAIGQFPLSMTRPQIRAQLDADTRDYADWIKRTDLKLE